MQSVETLRRLGELDREMIEHRVRSIMELRAKGQIDDIGEYLAADVVCQSRGEWSATLFPRPIVGKPAVMREFHRINMNYQDIESVIHELLIDGDRVILHRTTMGRNRGSARPYQFDSFMVLRFRDGLVTEVCEYLDPVVHDELEDL